jgi:hypothetical protein
MVGGDDKAYQDDQDGGQTGLFTARAASALGRRGRYHQQAHDG